MKKLFVLLLLVTLSISIKIPSTDWEWNWDLNFDWINNLIQKFKRRIGRFHKKE